MPRSGIGFSQAGLLLVLTAIFFAASRPLSAEEAKPDPKAAPAKVSYFRDIRPIFQEHCQGCHQPAKPGGEYVMTSFDRLLKGGETEFAAIVPGDPDESQIVLMITPVDGKADMPKDKPPLSENQVALVTRWIAEGAVDDTPMTERQVVDAEHPPVYKGLPVVTGLDYSPDGSLLAVSGYHEVLIHKADGSALVSRLIGMSERIESVAFSPDGKKLAVAGGSPGRMGEIQVWNVSDAELKLSVPVTYDTVYGANWSHDGTKISFGCSDNTVRAIDAATGEQVLYQGAHSDWVLDTVFSVDSKHLVSVSRDMSMKLIEVATQRFVDNITSITPGALKGGLISVDRHPTKDELVVGGSDGVPKIFRMFRDPSKPRQIGDDFNLIRALDGMPGRVFAVQYSSDGSRIVAASSNSGQGELRVYNADDGKLLSKFDGQPGPLYSATFSPDGQTIAAGGFQGQVLLVDSQSGKLKTQFIPIPQEQLAAGGAQ